MIKKFEEYIDFRENLAESFQESLDALRTHRHAIEELCEIFKNDLKELDAISNVYLSAFSDLHKTVNNELKILSLTLSINLDRLNSDVLTFFNKIKDYFNLYGYIELLKCSSTSGYALLLDFDVLKETNIFKSLSTANKYKLTESYSDPELNAIDLFEKHLRREAKTLDFMSYNYFPRIETLEFLGSGDTLKDAEYLKVNFEINWRRLDVEDVPEFFNKLKNYFKQYFYVKMKHSDSTNYFDVYLDYQKLKNSNIFKSLTGISKFKL